VSEQESRNFSTLQETNDSSGPCKNSEKLLDGLQEIVEKNRFKTVRYFCAFLSAARFRGCCLEAGLPCSARRDYSKSKITFLRRAQEFVALDGATTPMAPSHATPCAGPAEAAYTDGPARVIRWAGEKNFNGRAFLHIFLEEK